MRLPGEKGYAGAFLRVLLNRQCPGEERLDEITLCYNRQDKLGHS